MKTVLMFFLVFITALTLAMPDYAEAARMGGGRSFGSRPSMSQPAQRPMQTQRQATTAQTPGRTGMMGGMGGLFGGLLAGTLLGSLLSGHGFAGGGGGFLDIILFGILAFVAYKLFQRFRNRPEQSTATAGNSYFNNVRNDAAMNRTDGGADAWSRLKNSVYPPKPFENSNSNPDVPADFNQEEFLKGAKMAYNRMQQSWDKRDLNDIAQFATGAVMANLQQQLAEEPEPSHTEILMVDAQLLKVEQDGPAERAEVYFDVLMREDPNQQTPENVREIWHFMRMGKNGSWKLDGIQQVV